MKRKLSAGVLIITLLLGISLAGCASSDTGSTQPAKEAQTPNTVGYKDIDAAQLKDMMDKDKSLTVVDVREKDEFDQGHIAGAKLLPTSEIQSRVNELPKDRKIVLVCLSGSRSSQVAAYLVQLGYKDVYNLTGGISGWSYGLEK